MWSLEPLTKTFVAKAIYGLIAVMAVLRYRRAPPVPWRGAATLERRSAWRS